MNIRLRITRNGFTLIELLIGMTIFAVGLTAIYALLWSTMKNASYSRHEIIAANLMREQVEILKYIRDTNVKNFIPWESSLIEKNGMYEYHLFSGSYLIENNYTTNGIEIDNADGKILATSVTMRYLDINGMDIPNIWEKARLYQDSVGRYTHSKTGSGTPYALYTTLSPLFYNESGTTRYILGSDGKPQGFIIHTHFLIKTGGQYRHYDLKSAITHWIR